MVPGALVCVLVLLSRSPHKDRKTRKTRTSVDILPVTTKKIAISGLSVWFRVTVIVRVRTVKQT